MAEQVDEVQNEESTKRKGLSPVIWGLVALLAIGCGFATPLLINQLSPAAAEADQPAPPDPNEVPAFIEFDEVVVNLNENRLNRYLRLKFSLLVDESKKADITKAVESNRSILKSWLISYLADKGMDDIRGATGQNRLRREIQNHFNSVLFPDGVHRVRNILFEEFNIQ